MTIEVVFNMSHSVNILQMPQRSLQTGDHLHLKLSYQTFHSPPHSSTPGVPVDELSCGSVALLRLDCKGMLTKNEMNLLNLKVIY